jgi:hypothetical protein
MLAMKQVERYKGYIPRDEFYDPAIFNNNGAYLLAYVWHT